MQLLLERGSNVNECMRCGWSPLCRAVLRGNVEFVRLLLQATTLSSLTVGILFTINFEGEAINICQRVRYYIVHILSEERKSDSRSSTDTRRSGVIFSGQFTWLAVAHCWKTGGA
jgi:ankyrin repeat protein